MKTATASNGKKCRCRWSVLKVLQKICNKHGRKKKCIYFRYIVKFQEATYGEICQEQTKLKSRANLLTSLLLEEIILKCYKYVDFSRRPERKGISEVQFYPETCPSENNLEAEVIEAALKCNVTAHLCMTNMGMGIVDSSRLPVRFLHKTDK